MVVNESNKRNDRSNDRSNDRKNDRKNDRRDDQLKSTLKLLKSKTHWGAQVMSAVHQLPVVTNAPWPVSTVGFLPPFQGLEG